MLIDVLKKKVKDGRDANLPVEYIKIQLKEMLIYYTLNFIYNSPKWNELIFCGGTALKMIGGTARLSEDLDLDYLDKDFSTKDFVSDLIKYFEGLSIKDISFSTKQDGKIITLKFSVLSELGLISNPRNKSDLLYLKIDLEKNRYSEFNIKTTPLTQDNLFFVVKSYDLETLFANKIGAILGRKDKIYLDKYDFKGRDFYDLIWFLQNNIKPNLKRVKQIIKVEQGKSIENYNDIWKLISERINEIDTNGIYADMRNLVSGQESIRRLSNNFVDIYNDLIER